MKRIVLISALLAGCSLYACPAQADFNQHDWQIRVRAIDVSPSESSSTSNGGSITADSSIVPEMDISYFFNENISSELILATSKHNIGEASPDINLGSVWVLPPTLTAQYHFTNSSPFVPYVGAGINYTVFYNADAGSNTIKYKDGFGYALQAGTDYKIDEHWMLNVDVKKIFLNTHASVDGGAVEANVHLDPWVFGVGAGYRF